jgi:hypothetical protein
VHDESFVWEDKRNIQIVVVIEEEEENLKVFIVFFKLNIYWDSSSSTSIRLMGS